MNNNNELYRKLIEFEPESEDVINAQKKFYEEIIKKIDCFSDYKRKIDFVEGKGIHLLDKRNIGDNEKKYSILYVISEYYRYLERLDYENKLIQTADNFAKNHYPIIYNLFESRFDEFVNRWRTQIKQGKIEDIINEVKVFAAALLGTQLTLEMPLREAITITEDKAYNDNKYVNEGARRLIQKLIDIIFTLPNLIIESYGKDSITWEKAKKEFIEELRDYNVERHTWNEKIKNLVKQKRVLTDNAKRLSEHELRRIIEQCRLKNGKINYKKVGETIGRSNHTAKTWCNYYKLK